MPRPVAFIPIAIVVVVSVHPVDAGSPWKVVAGTGKSGFGGDTFRSLVHDFAIESKLAQPWGLALDLPNQRLYIADQGNSAVRAVDLTTGLMETIAGTGSDGFSGDGAEAVSASLYMPTGLALDVSRQILYISDTHNHRVRAMNVHVGHVYEAEDNVSIASAPAPAVLEGPEAHHTCPTVAVDQDRTALLMGTKFCGGSTGRGYARYVRSTRDLIHFHIQASVGVGEYELRFRYSDRHDAHERGARLMRLSVDGVVLDHAFAFRPTGSLQVGHRTVFGWAVSHATLTAGAHTVTLEVTGQGGPHIDQLYVKPPRSIISTVAGNGAPGPVNDIAAPVSGILSPLHTPLGLVLDQVGQLLYIADSDNGKVRRLDIAAGTISTLAGGSSDGTSRDGELASTSRLFRPAGLALDSARTYLYVTDSLQGRVRRIDLSNAPVAGGTITTVCGFGIQQAPFELKLLQPHGLVLDEAAGTLMIADQDGARIRVTDLSQPLCPLPDASRLECSTEGITPATCAALGCCYDAEHVDCKTQESPDGRVLDPHHPETVLTEIDGKERNPPVSFVVGRSSRCCYPKLHDMKTLELLDSPRGFAWDHVERALYVSQPKNNRVVKLFLSQGRCLPGDIQC